jgi:hypothetical protein
MFQTIVMQNLENFLTSGRPTFWISKFENLGNSN